MAPGDSTRDDIGNPQARLSKSSSLGFVIEQNLLLRNSGKKDPKILQSEANKSFRINTPALKTPKSEANSPAQHKNQGCRP